MIAYTSTFSTAFGPFSIAVTDTGGLLATAFGKLDSLRTRLVAENWIQDDKRAAAARRQIADYLLGNRSSFDLPLSAAGTPFQQRVWTALRDIPRGETRSYGQLAKKLRTSARAIGRANATNPICLIVPCHRVIGSNGKLTGYGGGIERKKFLLEFEAETLAKRSG